MTKQTIQPFEAITHVAAIESGGESPEFKAVHDFLHQFGYLSEGQSNPAALGDSASAALSSYQEQNGLAPTGAFDAATRTQMTTHRCGMPDFDSGVAFSTRCSWNKLDLTYAFDTGTPDVNGSSEFAAVRRAFDTWAAVTPLTFTEVGMTNAPDVVIDWRPANDPDHSMVGGVLAHADFPPGCGVVTNQLPKPVHFDDDEHVWAIGAVAGAFDIETVALHEIGHILGLQHSSVGGSVMFASVSSNRTKRDLTADDIAGIQQLYPGLDDAPPRGTYTFRQKSSGRFMDAHVVASDDFSVVTRPAQNNNTQRWVLAPVGEVFTMQQKGNRRFADAHVVGNDFSVVTRTAQNNDTQQWVRRPVGQSRRTFTFQQLSTGRFLDAHQTATNDHSVVTRPAQNNDTQRWVLDGAGRDTFTIKQKSSGRFLDAHVVAGADFSVVTRDEQKNDTQRWILTKVGAVYTVKQKSNRRFLDAHVAAGDDFSVVTRTSQNNDTQRWALIPVGNGMFTVHQLSTGRFLDAHQTLSNDFSVVTRRPQHNDTQRWVVTPA